MSTLKTSVLFVVVMVFLIPHAEAKRSWMRDFVDQYPQTAGSRLDDPAGNSCFICHVDIDDSNRRNSYGADWKDAGKNYVAIENDDSDGDGVSNIDEINALTFPGNASDVPAIDTTEPTITILGDNPATVTQGEVYTDAGATADDDVDGNVTDQIQVSGSVNTNTPGTYEITYSVTDDAGNTAEATRQVFVVPPADTTEPTITILGDNPSAVAQDDVYTDAGATAADDVDGNLTDQIQVSGSVDTGTPGTYEITYSVSDDAGNPAEAVREVIVIPAGDLTELEGQLNHDEADPLAFGSAAFEASGDERSLSVAVDRVFSAMTIEIVVGGVSAGVTDVIDGRAELVLDSRNSDTVPDLAADALVEVFDVDSDALILSGSISEDGMSHMAPRRHGDMNQDGTFNITDLEEVVLTALDVMLSMHQVDVDQNGFVEAFDVQILLDAGCSFRWDHGDEPDMTGFENGDVDGDGFEGGLDLILVWGESLGLDMGEIDADLNEDGSVDDADIDVMISIATSFGCINAVDVDVSGDIDAVDIQLVINGALGIQNEGSDSDVDGTGGSDAVDIQLVINGALGILGTV